MISRRPSQSSSISTACAPLLYASLAWGDVIGMWIVGLVGCCGYLIGRSVNWNWWCRPPDPSTACATTPLHHQDKQFETHGADREDLVVRLLESIPINPPSTTPQQIPRIYTYTHTPDDRGTDREDLVHLLGGERRQDLHVPEALEVAHVPFLLLWVLLTWLCFCFEVSHAHPTYHHTHNHTNKNTYRRTPRPTS